MVPFEFLGPYRIVEPIGRGGMGTVYRAVHEKTREAVAVKLIAAHVADDPKFRRRFDAEIKTLQRLRHEGIVRLIGFGEEEGQLFYSMELVQGEPLQSRIKRLKKLDWQKTLDIAIEVCAALKHAHDIGVIHRDLKPANLILTQGDHVKLVDFGIAKIFGDGQHTVVGSVLGTADYMAPEQATSSGITIRTDLYALGSLMYAMLTGRPPFSGKSTTEVIESLKRDRPVPLDIVNPDLPEALVEIVHQLLEKDPDERPPTALAVMNRLKAMRAGLHRAQTLTGEAFSTEAGILENASSDTNATEIGLTPQRGRDVSDDPTVIRPLGGTESDAMELSVDEDAARGSDVETTPTEVSPTRESKTVPSGGRQKAESTSQTHFQTVVEDVSVSSLFGNRDESTGFLSHMVSIAGMVVILVAGAALFFYATRPPTADQLYATAIEQGDAGAQKAFLKAFPDDPRAIAVRDKYMGDRVRGAIKRLSAQSSLGVTPLSAAEESFVAAMEGREQTPQQSSERLSQWLNAFDNDGNRGDPQLMPLIELAEYEQERLSGLSPDDFVDPRVDELLSQLEAISELEDPNEMRRRLEGTIETFADQDWAIQVVEQARDMLSSIGKDESD